jgi:hypothetical protein
MCLRCSYGSFEGAEFISGSCTKGIDKIFADLRAAPGSDALDLRYSVRSGTTPRGEVVSNGRLQVCGFWSQFLTAPSHIIFQFGMPPWAPVVVVVGVLFVGGLLLFVLLFILPMTGAGNRKF